jgi:phage/plasmid-like protein (TIGR03299 family)
MIKPSIFSGFEDVSTLRNAEDCIKEAKLDYQVLKSPNHFKFGDSFVKSDSFTTYRSDTGQPFGTVSDRYHIIQNEQAFSFFDSIVEKGEAIYNNAGFFGVGESIFLSARLPEYIRVGKDDIEQNIVLYMSHDGKGAIKAFFTPTRIICKNSLTMALTNATNKVSIRHSSSAEQKLKEASNIMGISNMLSKELEEIFTAMSKRTVTDNFNKKFVDAIFMEKEEYKDIHEIGKSRVGVLSTRKRNMIDNTLHYLNTDSTQQTEETRGTLYGTLNAITGYSQNIKNYKTDSDKLDSILVGTSSKINNKAFELAKQVLKQ